MKNLLKGAAIGSALLAFNLASAQVNGFTPGPGYWAKNLQLGGGVLAISPSGKLAVAYDNPSGGAEIRIFDRIQPEGRTLLTSFSANSWKFFGGLAWDGDNSLVMSENGDLQTILRWNGVSASMLAPIGSVPAPADVVVLPNQVLTLSAAGPGASRVFQVSGGSASAVSSMFGTGYGGGLVMTNSQVWAGDTNDPNFLGNPGMIHSGSATVSNGLVTNITFGGTSGLGGGGGNGLYSFTLDSEGDLLATTGQTLTQLKNGIASPIGLFTTGFPFPTSVGYWGSGFEPNSGNGVLVVNGSFTGAQGLFAVMPVPEPATIAVLSAGVLCLLRRRKK